MKRGWGVLIIRGVLNMSKLPYNTNLKQYSKDLRKAYNLSEALLWQRLKNKQINGLKFMRQKVIGNYIVDFYCAEKKVAVEIDGESHYYKGEYDEERIKYLEGLGITVIRFLDKDIRQKMNWVINFLENQPVLM